MFPQVLVLLPPATGAWSDARATDQSRVTVQAHPKSAAHVPVSGFFVVAVLIDDPIVLCRSQIRHSPDGRPQGSDPDAAAAAAPARLSRLQELLLRAGGERQFTGERCSLAGGALSMYNTTCLHPCPDGRRGLEQRAAAAAAAGLADRGHASRRR